MSDLQSPGVCLHHKDGYPVPTSVRVSPPHDADAQVIGAEEAFVENHGTSAPQPPESDLDVGHGLDPVTRLPDCTFALSAGGTAAQPGETLESLAG